MSISALQLSEDTFERLRRLIHEKTGIWMRDGKQVLVSNRLRRRLQALGLASFEEYYQLLAAEETAGGREEIAKFIDAVSTNETFFYREANQIAVLELVALPELLADGRRVRIWSAGCATGEEAYTLRFACDAAVERHGGSVEIVATDINTSVISIARAGLYRQRSLRLVPAEILASRFEPEGEAAWRVRADARDRVSFRTHNLLSDPLPPEVPFDAVFCRNVMIYFDKATQKRLVDGILASAARPGGWLFIGHAESLTGTGRRFVYRPVTLPGTPRIRVPVYRLATGGMA